VFRVFKVFRGIREIRVLLEQLVLWVRQGPMVRPEFKEITVLPVLKVYPEKLEYKVLLVIQEKPVYRVLPGLKVRLVFKV
jgi:hypothetical protein